jgi:Calcineurin-like phosphoesterase
VVQQYTIFRLEIPLARPSPGTASWTTKGASMKTLPRNRPALLITLACLLAACGEGLTSLAFGAEPAAHTVTPEQLLAAAGPKDALLAAAGDIADCAENKGAAARQVGNFLAKLPRVTVIAAGDIAYENGTTAQLTSCFDKVWAGLKGRTRPAPGNHDYGIYSPANRNDAKPYFAYFGANAGPKGKGFYSFDLGSWHVVSLNSMVVEPKVKAAAPSMKAQLQWLEADLAATGKPCILAFWHHPLFSSGEHGHQSFDLGRQMKPLWEVLQKHGADVIVNGHDHHYERFAPQSVVPGNTFGIREFVVGTGGAKLRPIEGRVANSDRFLDDDANDHGVLLLTLHPGSYEWKFVRTNGTVGDESTAPQACH